MSYQKIYKHFRAFVLNEDMFSDSGKQHILERFNDPVNQRVFRLTLILLVWSLLGAVVDSFLLGGGVVVSTMKGASWLYFLPEIIFFVVNTTAKVIFVLYYMKGAFSFRDVCFCGIPYLGPAFVIGIFLRKDRLLLQAFRKYTKHLRKRGVRKIYNLVMK